ncbi:MAG: hypothetical protein HKM98_09745 [Gammaproteobacteria bacterium]|nr:hypothetical protein [Gammaproteobacteria bacterium]
MSPWSVPVATAQASELVLRTPTVSNAWQVGTILKAVALSASSNGRVQLQIGARTIDAQTSLPLQSGETLRLKVTETGRNVVLQNISTTKSEQVAAAIREAMPRQLPQSRLIAAAVSLSQKSDSLPRPLATAVSKLLTAVRDASVLTKAAELRPAVRDTGNFLEKRLAYMQPDKAGVAAPVSRDWKAALLQFRSRLAAFQTGLQQPAGLKNGSAAPPLSQAGANVVVHPTPVTKTAIPLPPVAVTSGTQAKPPVAPVTSIVAQSAKSALPSMPPSTPASAPPMRHVPPQAQPVVQAPALPTELFSLVSELLGQSEGSLARVRLNQLASVTPEPGNRMVWLLELPVRHANNDAEVVTLRIEQDSDTGQSAVESAWTADLAFDLADKGELRARVALRAGRISVTFWADADQTRLEVSNKVGQLQRAMEQKELDVGCVSCGVGQPEAEPVPQAALLETQA